MSSSVYAKLNFGVIFDEDFEFPWDDDKYDNIENWWCEVNDYKNPNFNPYTEDKEYKPGVTREDPRIDTWFQHQTDWLKANPIPIELVNYCRDSCQMFMLAVPEVGAEATRGNPKFVDFTLLVVTDEQKNDLLNFLKKYEIEYDSSPEWYLTASS